MTAEQLTMDDFTKLKPCPFCGHEVRVVPGIGGTVAGLYCSTCRAFFMFKALDRNGRESVQELIETWNQRTQSRRG